jgi:hypothetical protein
MLASQSCGWPGVGQCDVCGTPLDTAAFDDSAVRNTASLGHGEEELLASYVLHPMHCGVLSYFAQFTNKYAEDGRIATPGYQWQIRSNGQPLDPYLTFEHIINPWGLAAFPVDIRLDHGATIEFVIRNIGATADEELNRVGGRIVGRHWYDTRFGGAPHRL